MGRASAFHFDFNPLTLLDGAADSKGGIMVVDESVSMADPRKIILGVSGGIAAYKSADLVRQLRAAGYDVQVVMTAAARQFITPLTLASLSGNKVITGLFHNGSDADALNSAIEHIDVAQSGRILLVAPATADVLAKFAHGIADDFLTTTQLAFDGAVIIAPAMNTNMWKHPATQKNVATLRGRGATIVEPSSGDLACGTVGPGRLAEISDIVSCVRSIFEESGDLRGETVLITAGPTREPLDPVRYISNRSSGRMGFALAKEARRRGARVVLVCGPVSLATPSGCERIDVETTQDMYDAVMARLDGADMAVMAAAASDYRAASPASQKFKKHDGPPVVRLEETLDILRAAGERKRGLFLVGFAAETENLEANARRKLKSKNCDLIVANPVGGATGFDSAANQGLILTRAGDVIQVDPMLKSEMAACIFDTAAALWRRQAA